MSANVGNAKLCTTLVVTCTSDSKLKEAMSTIEFQTDV